MCRAHAGHWAPGHRQAAGRASGRRALAIAYAVHVLDLYDHYVFRARLQQDLREQLKAGTIHSIDEAAQTDPHGLLPRDDSFQDRYFAAHRPRSALDYFLTHTDALSPI